MFLAVIRRFGALTGAFVAGLVLARFGGVARAAPAPLTMQSIDLGALSPADLPTPGPGENPNLLTKTLVDEEGAVIRIQIGTVPKHYHLNANEIQYVVDGTGSEWLGERRVTLKPGVMLIIPKGVAHGGTVESSGRLKIITIKTPPQAPTDNHLIP